MMPADPARRRLLGLGASALSMALLPGCAAAMPLRVAAHVWPGYELMFLARSLGWLPPEEATLIETRSATESLAALARGEVDGAALTLDEVLRARADGMQLTVALIFNVSAGADVVMARQSVRAPKDIAGRRVGAETSSVGAVMLHKFLERAGLSIGDVTMVSVAGNDHLAAWDRERLDAIVTYEPMASRLQAAGAHRLFDSRALPNTILDVLALRADVLPARADAVRALAAAHFRGLRHLQTNPQDAAYRMAAHLGLPAGEVYRAFSGLQLPTLDVNRRLLAPGGDAQTAAAALSAVMVRTGILAGDDDLHGLVSDAYLPRGEA